MLIGADLDNTIVCYDEVIYRAALDRRLIPSAVPACKQAVRDHLREHGREEAWIELQGYVYGQGMRSAVPFPGVCEFLAACAGRGMNACIISHRTRYPVGGPSCDLHRAAQEWLDDHGFYDGARIGLVAQRVYFELTRKEKLERIAQAGCSHFIDDLPEFLEEPTFPAGVQRILFDPQSTHAESPRWRRATSWDQIAKLLG